MKALLFLTLVFIFYTFNLLAGDEIGNGGNAVVCRDDNDNITSVEILDLYEGRILENLNYQESSIPYLIQAKEYIQKLDYLVYNHRHGIPHADGCFYTEFERLHSSLIFLPTGVGLNPIPDSFEFYYPRGCKVEQVANFRYFDEIYIDSDIWDAMSETQKAALLIHERVYEYYRSNHGYDRLSIRTRATIAQIFSKNNFLPMWYPIKPYFHCYTDDNLGEEDFSYFNISVNESGQLIASFINIGGRNIIFNTTIKNLSNQSQNLQDAYRNGFSLSNYLDSPITDKKTYVTISWPGANKNGQIYVRERRGRKEFTTKIICRPISEGNR